MTENERAVIEAAKKWKNAPHPAEREALALIDAVSRLEEDTCAATAIGGDPAWPYRFRCILPKHDGRTHRDKTHGEWSMR